MKREEKNRFGYWGQIFGNVDLENPLAQRKIWIGPMTREEMKEYDDTFRHFFTTRPPVAGRKLTLGG